MKVFLDTNVVLDWLLDRQDTFAEEATKIIEAADNKILEVYISAGSVYTISYVLEKSGLKGEKLRKVLLRIFNILKIAETTNLPFINACQRNMSDIEDAYQYEIALYSNQMDYFVTANIKDFIGQDTTVLPVITPAQMTMFL